MTTDPELERMFAAARRTYFAETPVVDVDHLVATACAAADRRRARRLTILRVVGVGVVLAVLVVWMLGFARGVVDVVFSVAMFAVPALAVLRWRLEALDGGGLRPWRTPPTLAAWSAEARRRTTDLEPTIATLVRIEEWLTAPAPEDLAERVETARAAVRDVRTRLERVHESTAAFVAACRTDPADANWRVFRDIDPAVVTNRLRSALTELDLVVRYATDLEGDASVPVQAFRRARQDVDVLHHRAGRRCGALVEAFDTLHRIATREVLQRAEVLGVVRRATSALAVTVSGWGMPPEHRSATRTALLTQAVDHGPSWGPAVRRARAAGREAILVGGA